MMGSQARPALLPLPHWFHGSAGCCGVIVLHGREEMGEGAEFLLSGVVLGGLQHGLQSGASTAVLPAGRARSATRRGQKRRSQAHAVGVQAHLLAASALQGPVYVLLRPCVAE